MRSSRGYATRYIADGIWQTTRRRTSVHHRQNFICRGQCCHIRNNVLFELLAREYPGVDKHFADA